MGDVGIVFHFCVYKHIWLNKTGNGAILDISK